MLIWKPSSNKWRHNDFITKNNGKIGPPRNQTLYIFWKVQLKSYPKMYFLLNLSHCVKIMGIYVKFWFVLPCLLINVMSRDPSCKFRKFLILSKFYI